MSIQRTILVVDDQPDVAKLYQTVLEDEGFQVLVNLNAKDALKTVDNQTVDLVVLDIRMPGMDGIELLNLLIQKRRGLPVIISSAYPHYKDNYLTWPATTFVPKSSDTSELVRAIHSSLNMK